MEHWSVAKYMPSITPTLHYSNLSRRSFGEGGYSKNTWDFEKHIKISLLLGYRSEIKLPEVPGEVKQELRTIRSQDETNPMGR